ncbi:MAG: branched-chain amino acid ABC transporter permease [Bacillota bacterium]
MGLIIYGLINSLSLFLASIGFALVYGVSRLPNFAHGALYILAGYGTWLFLNRLHTPYPMAVLFSLIITTVIGMAIYRLILIRVRGMPVTEIIASFAIGLAILEFLRWSGLRGTTHILPPFLEGTVGIAGVPVDLQRIIIMGSGIILLFVLWLFTHYHKTGLALRAIAQDERAALMLGIDSDLTATLALAFGSALAGMAAVLLLPLGNITVQAGYDVLIFAIAVSICGGLGSWAGTAAASFLIGFAQIITVNYLAPHFHLVVAMLIIIAILIARPSGIFGRQKELEERV